MKDKLSLAKVVPVLVFPDAAYTVPTAHALVDGGLPILEITLRTDASWKALNDIVAAQPDATVGVGTVLKQDQLTRAKEAGAQFAVSPGSIRVLRRKQRRSTFSIYLASPPHRK